MTAAPTEIRLAAPRFDIVAVSFVVHLLALALPLALLQIYDRILPAQAFGTAGLLVVGVALAILLEAFLRYGRSALFAGLGARYEAETTAAILQRLFVADIGRIERHGAAYIAEAVRSVGQVRDFWSGQAGAALYEAPFVVIYLGLIAYIGGWLAAIPAALFVVAALAVFVINPGIERAAAASEVADARRRDLLWNLFAGIGDAKAMGAENVLTRIYRRLNATYMAASARLETRLGWIRENAALAGQLSTVLVVAFGAIEVMNGQLTTGALAACSILAGRSIGPAMASFGYWSQLARMREAEAHVREMLALPLSPGLAGGGDGPVVERGLLRIEAPALLAAPVDIAPGEIVLLDADDDAIASRLLSQVAGLATDAGVTVRLDGRPLATYPHPRLREAVALVSRQAALVPGSILNNLTLFDPRYNQAAVDLGVRLGLQPYVDRLRHGILTEVGPGAAEHLDEGIYQRITLIRALVRRPRILLLDHAAIGIDLDGIKRLAAVLQSLGGDTAVLLATRRDALVDACTRRVRLGKEGA
jgi:ABC-type bacteriocin/lantibiotic exporter with double-glycine peptidase domain